MTQLGMGVAALNHDSAFAAAYEKGIKKTEYWSYALEDCINLIAKLPALAARIYRNVYNPGQPLPGINKDLDLVGSYPSSSWYRLVQEILMCSNFINRKLRKYAWIR